MNRSESPPDEIEMPKSESPPDNEVDIIPDRSSESTSPVDSEHSSSPDGSEESTDRSESSSSPEGDEPVRGNRLSVRLPLDELPDEIRDIVSDILDEVEDELEQNEEDYPTDEDELHPAETEVLDPHEVWEHIEWKYSKTGIIEEVDFNRCKFEHFIEELPAELLHCKVFLCNNVGLLTLEGLPYMPECHTLDLSGNTLPFSEIIKFKEKAPIVEQLNLNGNDIRDWEELDQILAIETLITLDMYGNGVAQRKGFRNYVFEKCPEMRYLDGYDRNGVEIEIGTDGESDGDELQEDSDEYEDYSDEDDIPLSYLDSSRCLEDDDSEDFEVPPRKRRAASVPNENVPVRKWQKVFEFEDEDPGPSKVVAKAVVKEVKEEKPARVGHA